MRGFNAFNPASDFGAKDSKGHGQAVVEGEVHRLSAEKSFVTSAGQVDSYIVSTRSAEPCLS